LTETTKIIGIPSNIEEIVSNPDNYLIQLYLSLMDKTGYEYTLVNAKFNSKLKLTAGAMSFLKSFGVAAVSGKVPPFPKTSGAVSRGTVCSIYNILNGTEGIDLSYFKLTQVSNPSTELFGDVWGRNYPEEKKMLDFIVHYYRTTKFEWVKDISSYMFNADHIAKTKGLDLGIKDELITPEERDCIESYFKSLPVSVICNRERLSCNSVDDVIGMQKYVKTRQQMLRNIKESLKTILSSRVIACFAPLKGMSKTNKARKAPIRELKANLEYTNEYKVFNPSAIGRIFGIAPLRVTIPCDDKDNDKYIAECKVFSEDMIRKGCSKASVSKLIEAHEEYLKLTVPVSRR